MVWDYNLDANKVGKWKSGLSVSNEPSEGRMGPNAKQHCAHGSSVTVFHFTDVRPFRYYTHRMGDGTSAVDTICTNEFVELPGGRTRFTTRIRLIRRGVQGAFIRLGFRLLFQRKDEDDAERLRQLLEALPSEPGREG